MNTEELVPPTAVAVPDLSHLKKIEFEPMLELKVVDEATSAIAKLNKQAAANYIKSVEAHLSEPKRQAHALWKWFTNLEATLTTKALAVITHSTSETKKWENTENQRREELRARLVEIQQQEAMPWEKPVKNNLVVIPKVQAPGWSRRLLPWKYRAKEPDGLMQLIKAIASGEVPLNDEFGTPILQLNEAHFRNAAKVLGEQLETRYPGIQGYREEGLS